MCNDAERVRNAMVAELNEIDADERFHYPCANVVINAPLALEQLAMEVRAQHCKKVLGLMGYLGPALDIRPGPRGDSK